MAALIQVSIEAFWHSYDWNLKHLCTRKFRFFVNEYYLPASSHDMDLKHALGILFDKWSWSMIFSAWSHDFFKNVLRSVNFALPFYQICYNMKTEFPQTGKFLQSRMHTPLTQIRVKANVLMYFLNLQKLNFPSKEFLFLKKNPKTLYH